MSTVVDCPCAVNATLLCDALSGPAGGAVGDAVGAGTVVNGVEGPPPPPPQPPANVKTAKTITKRRMSCTIVARYVHDAASDLLPRRVSHRFVRKVRRVHATRSRRASVFTRPSASNDPQRPVRASASPR